ncbi:MAG: hypothetical protein FD131_3202 [Rhodocyclaceae bacterium]|nr:MAG: hypothetical protein FD131_3202 [Rhodocyclaceae bacterium]
MKTIRVVAVGLILSAAMLVSFGQDFFQLWLSSVPLHSWEFAIAAIAPQVANTAGFQAIGAATFILLCLGIGLFVSSIFYSTIDDWVVRAMSPRPVRNFVQSSSGNSLRPSP